MLKKGLHIRLVITVLMMMFSMSLVQAGKTNKVPSQHHKSILVQNDIIDLFDNIDHDSNKVTYSQRGFLLSTIVSDDEKSFKSIKDNDLDDSAMKKGKKIKDLDDDYSNKKKQSVKKLQTSDSKIMSRALGFALSSKTHLFILYSSLKLDC